MNLKKLKIIDFKKIRSVELDLADVTILVGANGSGKSSIIQAAHFASCLIRQADSVKQDKTSTVSIDELDYLPTNNYKSLGHKSNWGNNEGTSSSKIEFSFEKNGIETTAHCELRSARNYGVSIKGLVPQELTNILRTKKKFFSAYIPGISGIPNREEKKSQKVVMKACSYGDSNVILRNVLLLLSQKPGNIQKIEEWIARIIGPIKIDVSHEEEKDLTIRCDIEIDSDKRPIELIGTGYLQLIQIFSYILLFKPGVLLIDEPDIHLHPGIQERLGQVLPNVAHENNLKIILTTHSPFIIRGASIDTNVYWLSNGNIESGNKNEIELALGWGAFGKKIIFMSEDKDTKFLRKIISQWPEIEKYITFYPGNGYKNLPTPDQAAEIAASLGGNFKVLVHRDRDCLNDEEVEMLRDKYEDKGVALWITDDTDIEAYFCAPEIIQKLLGCTEVEANEIIEQAIDKDVKKSQELFVARRKCHNEELYPSGGSPTNDAVSIMHREKPLKGSKGKLIFNQLKNCKGNKFTDSSVLSCRLNQEIALSLKGLLTTLLRSK
jgi:AAA15 family ATPase/GTPase